MRAEFSVLGQLAVRVDGREVDIGPARRRHVLAVLVFSANRPVLNDSLVDRVWGECPPRRASGALRSYVSRLRQILAGADVGTIHRVAGGYRLDVDETRIDLFRFRELVATARRGGDEAVGLFGEALGMWRGEPLAGLATPWADAQRRALETERFEVQLDHHEARLREGNQAVVLGELSTLAAAHPLNERVAGLHITALYRNGRQADAFREYERIRRDLAEELGTDPGPALRHLHGRLLAGDPPRPARPPAEAARADRTERVVPRQLPPAPAHFAGRAAELAHLTAALDQGTEERGTVLISALAGAGGIGKTWLALHWARKVIDRFPDGQLFVDLRGFSSDGPPMDPAVAMRGFLHALGVDTHRIPVDPHAQAALYRSLVAERRMLVVLDNAASADQVVPLLPGGRACTVVVTSRRTLPTLISRHGAQRLRLAPLTGDDAHALLTARLGGQRMTAEPRAVTDLIELCRGYALALGLIAGRAHAHPEVPLAHLVTELYELGLDALDDDDPAASLPAVLSWSYQALPPDQRTVFGLLGVAPGPDIGLSAAASVTGVPPGRTMRTLRALEDASLLARDAHGRYSMHDLIRAYAADAAHRDLAGSTRESALRRAVDYYLHTANAADRILDPHRHPIPFDPPASEVRPQPPSDDPAAMTWFHTEHANLLAAQHTAMDHGWHDTVCRLAWTLSNFHFRRGYRHDDLVVWKSAVAAAAHLTDPTIRSLAHRLLGRAHANLGHYEEGLEHLHRALALADEDDDRTCRAFAHRAIAWASRQLGDDRRALEHAAQALQIFRTAGQPVMEARVLNGMGWYAAHLGEHETARTHCQAALALHRRHHDPSGTANTLDSLGYIDHDTGRHRDAVDHYGQALDLYRELGYTSHAADTLDRLGHPYAALGQHDHARAVWREALNLYRQQGRDEAAARVRRHLAASGEPGSTR